METITVKNRQIEISNPNKMLWREMGITKIDYIKYLIHISSFLLPYTQERMLMTWHYPNGIDGKKVEKRSVPDNAPLWLSQTHYKGKDRMLLNNIPTLVWLAQFGALEFHVPFDKYNQPDYPTELAFDLDPSDENDFELACEVALQLKDILLSLGLSSVPKTSGRTGLQIFVPIETKYSFEEARKVNSFIAKYLVEKNPERITIDRVVERRGKKLYFDYLQLWKGRTMAAPYSVRATKIATISTPLTWQEIEQGVHPTDLTVLTLPERIKQKGDIFKEIATEKRKHSLDDILKFINNHIG
jgi:bifunctional non-homologous end joining protein LigD